MRSVARRSAGIQGVCIFAAFLAGPLLGILLLCLLETDSAIASIASPSSFCLTFVGGLAIWFGTGALPLLWRSWSSRRQPTSSARRDQQIPPGYSAFVILAVVLPSSAGLLVGLASSTPIPVAVGSHLLAGLVYGGLLFAAARQGYLPFPEPE